MMQQQKILVAVATAVLDGKLVQSKSLQVTKVERLNG
jgi:hypothetical protein